MKELKDMEFEELLKWAQEADWDAVTNEQWKDYESQCKSLAPKYFLQLDFCQLQEFYRTYSGDDIDPWFSAWNDSVRQCYPFSHIYEELTALENSVKVLLKEKENQPANITVRELNRLKGGI